MDGHVDEGGNGHVGAESQATLLGLVRSVDVTARFDAELEEISAQNVGDVEVKFADKFVETLMNEFDKEIADVFAQGGVLGVVGVVGLAKVVDNIFDDDRSGVGDDGVDESVGDVEADVAFFFVGAENVGASVVQGNLASFANLFDGVLLTKIFVMVEEFILPVWREPIFVSGRRC